MKSPPWDQRIARVLVRPLVKTPVTPNQLTLFTLAVALSGAGLLADGGRVTANWGAGLFVLARFLDHFDGELARQKGMTSRLGYYLDYISGALSYGALFLCLGIGFYGTELGGWAIALGASGTASAVISMFTNLSLDKHLDLEGDGASEDGHDSVGYPGFAGFELEDGIYLIAPITWAGYLMPFFVAAGIGAAIYCLWTCWTLLRVRRV
ncbi:MAG: CDP-alcohol phosphatidyltransferase family protein [Proteobacteria bacterium]|nr:CDP-alcohol phosphatidyltransferase family protein [Pseudomonadota bacterium]